MIPWKRLQYQPLTGSIPEPVKADLITERMYRARQLRSNSLLMILSSASGSLPSIREGRASLQRHLQPHSVPVPPKQCLWLTALTASPDLHGLTGMAWQALNGGTTGV